MTRWEHQFVRIIERELENYLDLMGSVGWQLVSAHCVEGTNPRYVHRLYFKRPLK